MDPILFKEQLQPIKDKYPIDEILKKCYPLKGKWSWDMINNDTPKDIIHLFRQIHLTNDMVKIGSGGHILPEWWVDSDFKHPLYKKLYVFMNGEEEEESEIVLEPVKLPVKKATPPKKIRIPRDDKWKDNNPLFNPRLYDDIKKGFLVQPQGVDILPLIEEIVDLEETEWLCANGSGEKVIDPKHPVEEFGLFGKEKCLKCVKTLAFLRNIVKDYSLDFPVDEYVEVIKARKNIWNWIQVGKGHWRDFEWVLVGSRDVITKTIRMAQKVSKPLQKRSFKKHHFDFDPSPIFTARDNLCLNISTGKMVSKTKETDQYGWVSDDPIDKLAVRAYIYRQFVKQYPKTIIPGKSDKWTREFFSQVENCPVGEYIDFETCKGIKYSAITVKTHEFSKMKFAKNKTIDDYSIKEIEYYLSKKLK
jgi:hypothetical protein